MSHGNVPRIALVCSSVLAVLGVTASEARVGLDSTAAVEVLTSPSLSPGSFASSAGTRILLVGAPLTPRTGDTTRGAEIARLVAVARANRAFVAAPLVEENAGGAGTAYLTMTMVDPNGRLIHRQRAVMPVVSIAGVVFRRADFREPLRSVEANGERVGIAAVGDAEVAIPRLSDRGASLILLAGAPLARGEAESLAELARSNNVALVVAATPAPGGVTSLVVDRDGRATLDTGPSAAALLPQPGHHWQPVSSLGLPRIVPQPRRTVGSDPIVELGRRLFLETALSETRSVACASCHQPMTAFTTPHALGTGVHNRQTRRNVPSLLNVAFRPLLRWDGYASSLENFVKYPMSGHNEMNFHYLDQAVDRLRQSQPYRDAFAQAFQSREIDFAQVELALATYMRTLVSGNSPFDRATVLGQRDAMTPSAWHGYRLFRGKAGCSECHTVDDDALFTDFRAHNTGLGWDATANRYRDIGVGEISTDSLSGYFLTPSLRDVARTAPYMHDGSLPTLRAVIDFFDRGGGTGLGRDALLRPLGLSEQEKRDLEAFLHALTGDARYDRDGRRLPRIVNFAAAVRR